MVKEIKKNIGNIISVESFGVHYRHMYLKIAWQLKTYIDTNSSIDFEKLH